MLRYKYLQLYSELRLKIKKYIVCYNLINQIDLTHYMPMATYVVLIHFDHFKATGLPLNYCISIIQVLKDTKS